MSIPEQVTEIRKLSAAVYAWAMDAELGRAMPKRNMDSHVSSSGGSSPTEAVAGHRESWEYREACRILEQVAELMEQARAAIEDRDDGGDARRAAARQFM